MQGTEDGADAHLKFLAFSVTVMSQLEMNVNQIVNAYSYPYTQD